jgi:hypothetical protein
LWVFVRTALCVMPPVSWFVLASSLAVELAVDSWVLTGGVTDACCCICSAKGVTEGPLRGRLWNKQLLDLLFALFMA